MQTDTQVFTKLNPRFLYNIPQKMQKQYWSKFRIVYFVQKASRSKVLELHNNA